MRHNRAVKKLITRIGGFRPWSDKDFDKKEDDSSDNLQAVEPHEPNEDRDEHGSDE
jgi:hypothetical protein